MASDDQPGGASLVKYPCLYTFRALGLAADDFQEHVRRVIQAAVGPGQTVSGEAVRVRASAKGKYLSVAVAVMLDSESQRRGVYEALWRDERVVFYL